MEVSTKRIRVSVDGSQLGNSSVFGTRQSKTGPCSIYMDPKVGIFLYCQFVSGGCNTMNKRAVLPTPPISPMSSIDTEEVVPRVATSHCMSIIFTFGS